MRETHDKENFMADSESIIEKVEEIKTLEVFSTLTSEVTKDMTITFKIYSICKYEAWDTLDFQFNRRLNHKEELFICSVIKSTKMKTVLMPTNYHT